MYIYIYGISMGYFFWVKIWCCSKCSNKSFGSSGQILARLNVGIILRNIRESVELLKSSRIY